MDNEIKKTKSRKGILVSVIVLVLCLVIAAGIVVYTQVIVPEQTHRAEMAGNAEASVFRNADVGDVVEFGTYNQTSKRTTNNPKPIEWLVLAKENNKALVVSQYALVGMTMADTLTDTSWQTCSVRSWLNETFIAEAFTEEQQAVI